MPSITPSVAGPAPMDAKNEGSTQYAISLAVSLKKDVAPKARILRDAPGEFFVTVSIPHGANKLAGRMFGGAIAQRVQRDGVGHPGKRIVVLGTPEHRALVVQPGQAAEKHQQNQCAHAGSDRKLLAGKF